MNLEYSNEEKVLYNQLSTRSRFLVKALKPKTAQEILDVC